MSSENGHAPLFDGDVLARVREGLAQMAAGGTTYHPMPGMPNVPHVDAEAGAAGLVVAPDDPHRLARIYLARECHHGDRPALVHQAGEFLRWDGSRYREDPDVAKALVASIRGEFERDHRLAAQAGGMAATTPVRKVTRRLVADAMQALASIVSVPADRAQPFWLGDGPWPAGEVLPCRNALVHLPGLVAGRGHRIAPTPRFFSTSALPYDFDPEAAEPAAWLAFLRQLWPGDDEAIACLQEWFGYVLLPDTAQQKILMVVGPTRSGKGTIARVLGGLVGPENVAGPSLAGLATNFGLAPLVGKAAAVIPDARLSGRSDQAVVVERLLSISGEDAMTVDRKHRPAWTGRLPTRLMLLTNELPRLRDASGALVGRLLLLRLTESFLGREDTELTGTLLAERPGILRWAIAGYARLRARGRFAMPASAATLVREMRELGSPVGQFVAEECVVGAGRLVPVDGLYEAFKAWCLRQGRDNVADKPIFGRDLRAVVPGIENAPRHPGGGKPQVRCYVGIGLKTTGAG